MKIHELLARRGVEVPCRTVQRYVAEVLGRTRGRGPTVRVNDGEPGDELQVDFGRMGLVFDPATGRDRVVHALIFTACFSRHCFVWLTHRQTTEAVIAGCEAAWGFFGGVFATLIPDNLSAVVDGADPLEPRFNQAFVEYAQARGFKVDPARVRCPQSPRDFVFCWRRVRWRPVPSWISRCCKAAATSPTMRRSSRSDEHWMRRRSLRK